MAEESRFLSVDLTADLDKPALQKISESLSGEAKLPGLTPERKNELDMAGALIQLAEHRYAQAAASFERLAADRHLRDAALYFGAKSARLEAEERTAKGKDAEAMKRCKEARAALIELQDEPAGPFAALQPDEYRRATLCYARGLAAENRATEARTLALSLLSANTDFTQTDRESLAALTVQLLKKDRDAPETRLLAERGALAFPDNTQIKSVADAFPPFPKAEPEPPPIKGEIAEGKPRPRPEEALFREANGSHSRGETEKAVGQFVKIFREYPGSLAAAKTGARLQVIVENFLDKEKKAPRYIGLLKSAPTKTLFTLAKSIWEKDFAPEAYELFEHLVERDPSAPEAGTSLYFMGRIHEDRGEWEAARKQFERVVSAYSSSAVFERAHFKIGWLYYLSGEYGKALEWLEYDRTLADSSSRKAGDLYWIAKAYEKTGKQDQAERYIREIGLTAPLSYYAFLSGRTPAFVESVAGTPSPNNAWDQYYLGRARTFLAVGLPVAAAQVLNQIDLETDPGATKEAAFLYGAAKQHGTAMAIAAKFLNRAPESFPKDWAKTFFPVDHEKVIDEEAKANKLDPLLLFSLIKQESGFRGNAESRAGALGLMQLMPQTARDVAQELSQPAPERSELLLSSKNVKLGARYLASLLKKYDGNLAYALACYNAGPIPVDAWKKRWGNLPLETFIEIIPYEETRNYVKSIIRNYAYYAKLLENRSVELKQLSMIFAPPPA